MPEIPEFFCHYVCGECAYDAADQWSIHQTHYEAHRAGLVQSESEVTTP